MEEKKNNKQVFIIIIALVIVIVGISLAYAFNQMSLNKEKEAKISELQKKVNSLTDSIETLQSSNQNSNQAPVQPQIESVPGSWPTYNNENVGFSLTFPETWQEYLVGEGEGFIDFGFEAQNPIARINFITHEQWNEVRPQSVGLVYVGETDDFVVIYSLATQAVSEEIKALALEFPEIMTTFSLTEGELTVVDYSDEILEEAPVENEELNLDTTNNSNPEDSNLEGEMTDDNPEEGTENLEGDSTLE